MPRMIDSEMSPPIESLADQIPIEATEPPVLNAPPPPAIDWRAMAAEIFGLILMRSPNDEALNAFADKLATSHFRPIDMVRELLEGEEFGQRALQHISVAHHVSRTATSVLLGRTPEKDEVCLHARALQDGGGLESMLLGIVLSEEFTRRMQRPEIVRETVFTVRPELGRLAEDLVAAQLMSEGRWNTLLGRNQIFDETPCSENRLRALLHTLAMLARHGAAA